MPKTKDSCKLRLEYRLFAGLVFLVKHTPGFLLGLEKKILALLLKIGSPRHARRITRNLVLAFPDAAPAERDRLKKRIYGHFSSIFMEIARVLSRRDPEAILARTQARGMDALQRALEKKRGVIVFSAHFGNWEWIPLILRERLGRSVYSVARPLDNPLIEAKIREFREALGSRIIYKQGSLRTILKRLGENEIVCLLIDQNTVAREGVFVDFFARKASAITTVSQLYLKKRIPVVPAFIHYEGQKIVFDVLPEVEFAAAMEGPAALAELTQMLTGLIESQVRKYPEQWLWFHDRWRTKPQGEAP